MITAGILTVVFMLVAVVGAVIGMIGAGLDDDGILGFGFIVGWVSGALSAVSGIAFVILVVIQIVNNLS